MILRISSNAIGMALSVNLLIRGKYTYGSRILVLACLFCPLLRIDALQYRNIQLVSYSENNSPILSVN